MKLRLKQRNNASFFLIAAIKLNKRFISICLASESPLANFRVAASLWWKGAVRGSVLAGHPVGWPHQKVHHQAMGSFMKEKKSKNLEKKNKNKNRLHAKLKLRSAVVIFFSGPFAIFPVLGSSLLHHRRFLVFHFLKRHFYRLASSAYFKHEQQQPTPRATTTGGEKNYIHCGKKRLEKEKKQKSLPVCQKKNAKSLLALKKEYGTWGIKWGNTTGPNLKKF